MGRLLTAAVGALVLCGAGVSVRAQPAAGAALSDLGSSDCVTREAATRRLMADRAVTLEQIKRLYALADLPEQRHRLVEVARHHVLRAAQEQLDAGGAASVGVSLMPSRMSPEQTPGLNRAAVAVVVTFPGFPGHVYLRPGDLVVAIDGEPIPSDLPQQQIVPHFQQAVRRRRPGEMIRLSFFRDQEMRDVQFEMASLPALEQMYDARRQAAVKPQFRDQWLQAQAALLAEGEAQPPLLVDLPQAGAPEARGADPQPARGRVTDVVDFVGPGRPHQMRRMQVAPVQIEIRQEALQKKLRVRIEVAQPAPPARVPEPVEPEAAPEQN